MRTPSRREWMLIALVPLLAALGFVMEGKQADGEAAPAAVRPGAARPAAPARPQAQAAAGAERAAAGAPATGAGGAEGGFPRLAALRVAGEAAEPGEAFVKRSWYVAPPPVLLKPAPPAPPPAPTAPPLPFTYLGTYGQGAQMVIFLVKGDSVLTVRKGDVLDGNYRVEGVEGSHLGLTYLPLNIRQNLEVGPQS